MRQLRPMRTARGMIARLPTMVMPVFRRVGSWRLGMPRSAPSPTCALGPTETSLSMIERSMIAPARMTVSKSTMLSRTTAPMSTRTPGERIECSTVPATWQPWLMRLLWMFAVGPMRAGARSSERVWMSQSRSCRSS